MVPVFDLINGSKFNSEERPVSVHSLPSDSRCMIEEQHKQFAQKFPRCLSFYSERTEDRTLYNAPGWIPVYNISRLNSVFQLNRLCPKPWRYRTPQELQSLSFTSSRNTYEGGGYVAVLGYNSVTAFEVVRSLESRDWIDDKTAAVFIEFTTFEPSSSLFNSVKFVYERFPSGGSSTIAKVRTLTLYSPANVRFRLFYQTCHLFFMIVILFSLAIEIGKGYRQGWCYFKDLWNCCNLILLLCIISSTVMFFLKESFTSKFVKKVQENPFGNWSMDSIILWSDLEVYLLSFVVFLVTVKMLALLRFNRHIVQMKTTLHLAAFHLVSFSLVFVILLLAYVQLGTLLFGISVQSYSSFDYSLRSVLQMMIGGKAPFHKLQTANGVLGPLFVFIYMASMIMILLNMFMAILNDSYTDSRTAGLDELEDMKLAKFIMRQTRDAYRHRGDFISGMLGLRKSGNKYRMRDEASATLAAEDLNKRQDAEQPQRTLDTCNFQSRAEILLASMETLNEVKPEVLEESESRLTDEERTLREVKDILTNLSEELLANLPRLEYETGLATNRMSLVSCSYDDWKRYSCSSLIGEYKRSHEISPELLSITHGSEESIF